MKNNTKTIKKILIVDDSALMRRMLCDIINSDERFEVTDEAANGLEAFDLLSRNIYDAVVLDVNMPKMDGIELLRKIRKFRVRAKVIVVSNYTYEGAKVTMDALAMGALDFIQKPDKTVERSKTNFREGLLKMLDVVSNGDFPALETPEVEKRQEVEKLVQDIKGHCRWANGTKIVAIASSTGGPRALQAVIPYLPKELDAAILLVQHMPKGFSSSLAERLDDLSKVRVKEAEEGEEIQRGTVYIAKGGQHMNVRKAPGGKHIIRYSDEPAREGVKPSANYMYESLSDSSYDHVVCVVMTGMGSDGTAGIRALKPKKGVYVIAQNRETSTVYGMPKSVMEAGLANVELPLEKIAQEIVLCTGVRDM
jgi:two-component system chemotaxis response regulator CheB